MDEKTYITIESGEPSASQQKDGLINKTIVILSNNDGGLYQFRRELMTELINRGNQVVASIPGDTTEPTRKIEDLGVKVAPTPIDRRGINPKNDLQLFRNYKRLLKQEKPDLVITYTIKPNVYGGRACQEAHIPYVCNISGLGTAFQNEGALKTVATKMYKAGMKNASVVFFENESNRDTMVDLGIVEKERTHVLPGAGVNTEHFAYAPYPTDGAPMRFLFLGRIMREKGVDELLEAMRLLHEEGKPVHFDMCGMYEEETYKEKLATAEKEGWLTYHGSVSDVRPYIANCHCFVLPSWHEGMANTNLEAASMGRPVITSDIPGCREAVVNGESGFLVKQGNKRGLYDAIVKFTDLSYDERKKMGVAGRELMIGVFDKKKVVAETIMKLEKLV